MFLVCIIRQMMSTLDELRLQVSRRGTESHPTVYLHWHNEMDMVQIASILFHSVERKWSFLVFVGQCCITFSSLKIARHQPCSWPHLILRPTPRGHTDLAALCAALCQTYDRAPNLEPTVADFSHGTLSLFFSWSISPFPSPLVHSYKVMTTGKGSAAAGHSWSFNLKSGNMWTRCSLKYKIKTKPQKTQFTRQHKDLWRAVYKGAKWSHYLECLKTKCVNTVQHKA